MTAGAGVFIPLRCIGLLLGVSPVVIVLENTIPRMQDSGNDYKPDLCVIDRKNSKAFIIAISNPFDTFIDDCYNHKFHNGKMHYIKKKEV